MSNGECKFRINPEGKIECKHVSRQRFFRRENFPFHNRWNVIYRLGKASQRQLPNERREKRFFDNFQLVQFITINVRCSSTFFMLLHSETASSSWKFQLNLYSHYPKKDCAWRENLRRPFFSSDENKRNWIGNDQTIDEFPCFRPGFGSPWKCKDLNNSLEN